MICLNCGSVHALSDNFCRRCGWNLSGDKTPMVIENKRSLVPYQAEQALAIGGAATVVVGALAWLARQWLAHKVVGSTANRLPAVISKPQPPARRVAREENVVEDVQIESWLWVRHIRIRR